MIRRLAALVLALAAAPAAPEPAAPAAVLRLDLRPDHAARLDCAALTRVVTDLTSHPAIPCPPIRQRALPAPQAAAWVPEAGEIWLDPTLTGDPVLEASYLLHELVHAHQEAAGLPARMRCTAALEAEAYRVQGAWLAARNHPDGPMIAAFAALLSCPA